MPLDRCGHSLEGQLAAGGRVSLDEFWAKGFSQFGADGVLWAIFKVIGDTDRRYVEFGVQQGCERNTRWLAERCGWHGLLLDGSHENPSVNLSKAYISAGNVAQLFRGHRVPLDFDLLSVDIDGQDWHVWRALGEAGFRPRVVIIEYSGGLGYPVDVVPPRKDHAGIRGPFGDVFECGGVKITTSTASAAAIEVLGRHLGYRLVYAGLPDLYFLREDVAAAHASRFWFPTATKGGWEKLGRIYHPKLPDVCKEVMVSEGMLPAGVLLGETATGAAEAWAWDPRLLLLAATASAATCALGFALGAACASSRKEDISYSAASTVDPDVVGGAA